MPAVATNRQILMLISYQNVILYSVAWGAQEVSLVLKLREGVQVEHRS